MAEGANQVEQGSTAAGAASISSEAASPSTDEIRTQIARTRAELSGTIDAIQERLSPSRAIADARASVAEATRSRATRVARGATDSAHGALEMIRQNPVPATLLGGATGLILQAVRMRQHQAITSRTREDPWLDDHWRHGRASDSTVRAFVGVATAAIIGCWAIWRTLEGRHKGMSEPNDVASLDA